LPRYEEELCNFVIVMKLHLPGTYSFPALGGYGKLATPAMLFEKNMGKEFCYYLKTISGLVPFLG